MAVLKKNCGFTIMEIAVALAVAGILMGVALPTFISWLPTYRLSAAARQVASDLQLARMKAISQNTKYRLNFINVTSYQFEKDNSGTYVTESGPFSLPEGITTTVGVTSEFQPRGTASAAGTITLQNDKGETKTVEIAFVGRVKVL